jgi:1,2-diacylglycerol 3-alpha-glucosyltransferase
VRNCSSFLVRRRTSDNRHMPRRQPLRIAIFGESYLPYRSGVTVSTETLARGLAARGHEVLLVVPRPARGEQPGTVGARGPEPVTAWLPSAHPPGAPPGYRVPLPVPSAALRRAEAMDPDIVHANSPFTSGVMARALARRVRAPLVFTHHTRFGDYGHYLGPLAPVVPRVTGRWLASWWSGCAAVIAPGSELADEIRDALAPRQRPLVRWIPTGIDVDAIAALPEGHPRRRAGWDHAARVVVSLGRVAAEKNVLTLVDAFAVAAKRRPRLRLLLVGGGPAERLARERAEDLGLADRVHVTGGLPREVALMLVKASDVFAFASRTETQGLVLAEALACGLPVAALDGPGVAGTIRDGRDGLLVAAEPADTQAERLGDAIGHLASDRRMRAQMAAAALAGARRFEVRKLVARVEDLYREVLAARR